MNDFETNLADHGVRKYDNTLGQFTSIDPLWEKYYGWTPYHYCGNNPMRFVDPTGFAKYLNDQGDLVFNDGDPNDNNEYYSNSSKEELNTVLDNDGYFGMATFRKNQRPNKVTRGEMQRLMNSSQDPNNRWEYLLIESLGGAYVSRQGDENSGSFGPLIEKLKENEGDNKVPWIFFHTHKKDNQYNVMGTTLSSRPGENDLPVERQLMENYPDKPNSIFYDPKGGKLMYYNTEKVIFTITREAFLK
jgi:RHS repeat-associated protein